MVFVCLFLFVSFLFCFSMKFLPFFNFFVLFCVFCWLISVSFIFVIVLLLLLLLFCFFTDCLTGRSQAKLGNTRFLSQSPF